MKVKEHEDLTRPIGEYWEDAINSADCFVFMVGKKITYLQWMQLGIALKLGKHIIALVLEGGQIPESVNPLIERVICGNDMSLASEEIRQYIFEKSLESKN